MKEVILKDWGLVPKLSPYTAPECQIYGLGGLVYNHPDFPNGHRIVTSDLLSYEFMDTDAPIRFVFTCGSRQYVASVMSISDAFLNKIGDRKLMDIINNAVSINADNRAA